MDTIRRQVEYTLNQEQVSINDIITLARKELERLNIDYTTINFSEYGQWASLYPSLYISKHENASVLLVFPLHNNPLLLSTMLYLTTLDAPINILVTAPQNDAQTQIQQIQELLRNTAPAVLWVDQDIQSSALVSLGGSNRQSTPLFLNRLLLKNIKTIPVTASTHLLQHSSVLSFSIHDIPLELLLDNNIPAAYLRNSASGEIDSKQWIYSLATGLQTTAEELLQHYPLKQYLSDWEGNYLAWNILGITFFIPERVFLIFFILLLCSTLFYGIYFRSVLKKYATRIIKHWYVILSIIITTIMINGTSSLIIWFLIKVLGEDVLFERWLILLKLALTFFLFTTLYKQLSRTSAFWTKNRYLSATTLFLQLILLLIMSSQALIFSFYIGISYLMTFFFTMSRRPKVKMIFLFCSTLPLFYGLYNILLLPSRELISFLLYNPILGNIVWMLIILPSILMFIRIDHLVSISKRRWNISIKELASLVFLTCTTILLLTLPAPRIPISFHEIINSVTKQRTLVIKNNAALAGFYSFTIDEQDFVVSLNTSNHIISLPYYEPSIIGNLNINQIGNLYQYNYTISNSHTPAYQYAITHAVPESYNFIIRYASIPTNNTIGKAIRLSELQTDIFPPKLLKLEYRIESLVAPESTIIAEFDTISNNFIVESSQILPKSVQTVIIQPRRFINPVY